MSESNETKPSEAEQDLFYDATGYDWSDPAGYEMRKVWLACRASAALSASQAHGKSEAVAYPAMPEPSFVPAGVTSGRRFYTARDMQAYVDADRAQRPAPAADAPAPSDEITLETLFAMNVEAGAFENEVRPLLLRYGLCEVRLSKVLAAEAAAVAVPVAQVLDEYGFCNGLIEWLTFNKEPLPNGALLFAIAPAAPSNPSQSTGDSVRVEGGEAVAWEALTPEVLNRIDQDGGDRTYWLACPGFDSPLTGEYEWQPRPQPARLQYR